MPVKKRQKWYEEIFEAALVHYIPLSFLASNLFYYNFSPLFSFQQFCTYHSMIPYDLGISAIAIDKVYLKICTYLSLSDGF